MSMTNRGRPSVAASRLLSTFLVGFLIAGSPLALAPFPADAQDIRSLSDQVMRLQRELTDLQRQVYAGGTAGATTGGTAGGGSLDANQEIRLQQLESELQELTGSVEEATFSVRQVSDRLDKLIADIDFRLRALEQGGGTPMAQAPDADGAATSGQQSNAAANPSAQTGTGPQTLGTLTQEQVDGFQDQQAVQSQAPTQNQAAALPSAPSMGGGTPEEQYDYAFGLLRQANYPEAESALKGFIERYPDHSLAGNAQYWLGETYYVRGDYTQAAVAFAEGYQKYPEGGKAADNLLKLGMSLAEIGKKEDACRAFVELERQFPGAPANLKARADRESQRNGCS